MVSVLVRKFGAPLCLGAFCAQRIAMRLKDLLCAKMPCFVVVSKPALFWSKRHKEIVQTMAPKMTLTERGDMQKHTFFFGAQNTFARKKRAPTKRYVFRGFDATWPHY